MKKYLIIFTIVVVCITAGFGQTRKNKFLKDEYNYFSAKFGMSHSFLDKQPGTFQYKFIDAPLGNMQLIPVNKYIGYTKALSGGATFTHDFRKIHTGIVIGVMYENYGISSKFQVLPEYGDYTVIEKHYVNAISIPFYIKFGHKYFKKNMYDRMQFFYTGFNYNINKGVTKTEQSSWDQATIVKSSLDNAQKRNNMVLVAGYNHGFLNFELKYVPGGFFNRNKEISLKNNTLLVKPYSVEPKGVIYLTTSFVVPINVWTKNKSYDIAVFLRKIFGGN